jgi:hypothetical protein
MGINFRYGGVLAMVAAVFCMLGPVAARAGQIPGTSVPGCAGTCGLKAPAAHLSGVAGTPIVLTSMIKRSDRCGWWDGEWRCGDFDHFHHHHYRHYGHYSHYSHYSHYGNYGRYSRYSHYGNHGHYSRYSHYGYGHYSHYR